MSSYRHPVFDRSEGSGGVGILDLDKGDFELKQESTSGWDEVSTDLDAYFRKLHRADELRARLGIPRCSYHTYGFPSLGYNICHVRNLVEWARGHDLELRIWINDQSALMVLAIADPDTSEGSGLALYQYAQDHAASYESYGLASWFEYCKFGVPVPDDWQLIERNDCLFAASVDGKHCLYFGR